MNKLLIVYEDEFLLVVDKPAGIVVNRSETIKEETLQDLISEYFHLGDGLGIGERAGIVHRLDRETSGLMVVAKTEKAFGNLQSQFKERKVKKVYTALAHGILKNQSGVIKSDIGRVGKFGKFGEVPGGREAITNYQMDNYFQIKQELFESLKLRTEASRSRKNYLERHARLYSLLSLFPKSGRTHQIRVHLKSIGHPLVSDLIYSPRKLLQFDLFWCPRLFLHARSLEFVHPQTKKPIFFESSLPDDLTLALSYLIPIR